MNRDGEIAGEELEALALMLGEGALSAANAMRKIRKIVLHMSVR